MKRILFFLLIILFFADLNSVDYLWCLQQTKNCSREIKKIKLSYYDNDITIKNQWADVFPEININYGYSANFYNDRMLSNSIYLYKSYSLSEPFFLDWQDNANRKEFLRHTKENYLNNIELEVLIAYNNCLVASQKVKIAQADTLFWHKQVLLMEKTADNVAYMQAKALYFQAKINKCQVNKEFVDNLDSLTRLTNCNLPDSVFLPLQMDLSIDFESEPAKNIFYQEDYEVKQNKNELIRRNLELLPDVNLSASYSSMTQKLLKDGQQLYDFDGNYISRNSKREYWEVYCGLSWNITSLWEKWNLKSLKKRNLAFAQETLNTVKKEAKEKLKALFEEIETQKTSLLYIEQQVAIYEKLYKANLHKWQNNLGNYSELTDSLEKYNYAQIQLVINKCALSEAILEYKLNCGTK